MTRHQKATKIASINLTSQQIAALKSICDATLAAQPQLRPWIRLVDIGQGTVLPFLPIRTFRLTTVSRIKSIPDGNKERIAATFFSSGSTNSQRARHTLTESGLRSYRLSACTGLAEVLARFNVPAQTPIVSFVPPASEWSESSLSAMLTFWSEAGYPVQFVNVQDDPAALQREVSLLNQRSGQLENLILFGTSLHHLLVSQWHQSYNSNQSFIDAKNVWCFDTGGTKGRTQTTNHDALAAQIRRWFSPDSKVQLLSEYGMCELSSQAYSSRSPHTGEFRCSSTLRAVSLSPDLSAVLPPHTTGFLSFIDLANVDSWPCLITEDLGATTNGELTEFKLIGRAPDATMKGCSLNVRDNFQFSLRSNDSNRTQHTSIQGLSAQQRQALAADRILANLSPALWPPSVRADLHFSLQQQDSQQRTQQLIDGQELYGRKVSIIASANIPISWLFPAIHAWLMGAASVRLFLPSIRAEAPISGVIREQINDLAHAINFACGFEFICVDHARLFDPEDTSSGDHLVVFGSNETLDTIRSQLIRTRKPIRWTGLGHFQNTLSADGLNADQVAKACSLWMGRGCLTPLLVRQTSSMPTDQRSTFAQAVFEGMRQIKTSRMEEISDPSIFEFETFAHQQNLVEMTVLLKQRNIEATIHHDPNKGVVVVDLGNSQTLPQDLMKKALEFAGCGWINIIYANERLAFAEENPTPSLYDTHQGRTWYEWITQAEQICAEETLATKA